MNLGILVGDSSRDPQGKEKFHIRGIQVQGFRVDMRNVLFLAVSSFVTSRTFRVSLTAVLAY